MDEAPGGVGEVPGVAPQGRGGGGLGGGPGTGGTGSCPSGSTWPPPPPPGPGEGPAQGTSRGGGRVHLPPAVEHVEGGGAAGGSADADADAEGGGEWPGDDFCVVVASPPSFPLDRCHVGATSQPKPAT